MPSIYTIVEIMWLWLESSHARNAYKVWSLYTVIGDFFMITRLLKDMVFQIKEHEKHKNVHNVVE